MRPRIYLGIINFAHVPIFFLQLFNFQTKAIERGTEGLINLKNSADRILLLSIESSRNNFKSNQFLSTYLKT